MMQRIQTIWLFISAISSGFLMKGGIVNFIDKTGIKYFTGFPGICTQNDTGNEILTKSFPLAALIILIPVLSMAIILLFRLRKIQKVLSLILITFSFCLIILVIYYSYLVMKNYDAEIETGFKMAIPVIILTCSIFANRGIINDDKLVKSYDRLR
jgi:hypothetical protein